MGAHLKILAAFSLCMTISSPSWASGDLNVDGSAKNISKPEESGIGENLTPHHQGAASQVTTDKPKSKVNQVLNIHSLQPVERPNQPWHLFYNATPDPKELKRMHSYSASKTDALKLARSGKLHTQTIEYLIYVPGNNVDRYSWGTDSSVRRGNR